MKQTNLRTLIFNQLSKLGYEFETVEGAENSLKGLKASCGASCATTGRLAFGEGTIIYSEYELENGKQFLIRFRVKNVVVVLFARVNNDLLADDITALDSFVEILENRLSNLKAP